MLSDKVRDRTSERDVTSSITERERERNGQSDRQMNGQRERLRA